jgi:hypothetical protein
MCRVLAALMGAAFVVWSAQAFAQSPDADAILKRLEAKVDALAKENAELRDRVRKLEPARQTANAKAKTTKQQASPPAALDLPPQILPPVVLVERNDPGPNTPRHTGGIVLGVEGMLIKPYYSGDGEPNVDVAASNPFTGFVNYPQFPYDFKGGFRTWLGYVDASGWGARVRYFDYHQAATNDVSVVLGAPAGIFTQTGALTVQSYDFDITKQLLYGDWSLTAFGGVRWASAHQRSDVQLLGAAFDNLALTYNGVGPTAGLEGEAALTPGSQWSVVFSGRGSLLYGTQTDNTFDFAGLYTPGFRSQNAFASTWELNIGPQWKTPVAGVGDVFFRVTADAQYWQGVGSFAPIGTSPAPGLSHNDYSGSFGLIGFTAAMGVQR